MKRHRVRFGLPFLPAFTLMFFVSQVAEAGVISRFYSTGVNASGTILSNGSLDVHYRIADEPLPEYGVANSAFDPTSFDDSLSKSIYAPTGYGAFVLAINFGGASQVLPETVSVTGIWSSSLSDAAFDILLNGQPLDENAPTTPGAFTIPAGSQFRAGVNYLTFIAVDLSGSSDLNYLRVELNAQGASVPEPTTLLLWSCGLLGILAPITWRPRQLMKTPPTSVRCE